MAGSSGGTAALVAARGAAIGLCTDTGGSCRIPASLTGPSLNHEPTYKQSRIQNHRQSTWWIWFQSLPIKICDPITFPRRDHYSSLLLTYLASLAGIVGYRPTSSGQEKQSCYYAGDGLVPMTTTRDTVGKFPTVVQGAAARAKCIHTAG